MQISQKEEKENLRFDKQVKGKNLSNMVRYVHATFH
jgi:hypothetical protein